jgi:hypothetical protein
MQILSLKYSASLIYSCLKSKVVVAPVDVYLNEENVFQPDILFVSEESKEIIH